MLQTESTFGLFTPPKNFAIKISHPHTAHSQRSLFGWDIDAVQSWSAHWNDHSSDKRIQIQLYVSTVPAKMNHEGEETFGQVNITSKLLAPLWFPLFATQIWIHTSFENYFQPSPYTVPPCNVPSQAFWITISVGAESELESELDDTQWNHKWNVNKFWSDCKTTMPTTFGVEWVRATDDFKDFANHMTLVMAISE